MSPDELITHLVGASALILVIAHGAGWLARRLGQPAIIGQLTAGIALGPSVLGEVSPAAADALFPAELSPVLSGLAQIALVLFLFAVGYELDLSTLRSRARGVLAVSAAAFVVPMAAGCGAALLFREPLRELGLPERLPVEQVLFLGVALSITAVPVLTAIVRENGLAGTVPGVVAISAAGVIDVLGWTVLVGTMLPTGEHGGLPLSARVALMALFTVGMLLLVRPLLRLLLDRARLDPSLRLALLAGFAFGSAWVTSVLGLHVIFGALLAGVVAPREPDGTLDPDLLRPLHDVGSLLLPFFFVVSGRGVEVGGMPAIGLVVLLVVTALGIAVKVGSGTVAARFGGLGWRDAGTVGILLSTRGLTELIALNAGLEAGLLSPRLYTVLVLMALATTLLTQPLLTLQRGSRRDQAPGAVGEAAVPQPTAAPGGG
ncbi:cation:proton antiporter [Streptomyces hainanensis]|uniref:Integral membrane ion exchanger n=1 Tax=Streptomyces hainanensis TaxID=402648 RepID=A0A4R4T9M6_9ACTN|nr:cation:proton antiporter [Streptomyces hainanensis]TDC73807.1 integral membrane ion exchanger [Streptomyces hainanensis]